MQNSLNLVHLSELLALWSLWITILFDWISSPIFMSFIEYIHTKPPWNSGKKVFLHIMGSLEKQEQLIPSYRETPQSQYKVLQSSDDFGEQEVLARRESSCLVQWVQQGCSLHTVLATKTKLTSYESLGEELLLSSCFHWHQGRVYFCSLTGWVYL